LADVPKKNNTSWARLVEVFSASVGQSVSKAQLMY